MIHLFEIDPFPSLIVCVDIINQKMQTLTMVGKG